MTSAIIVATSWKRVDDITMGEVRAVVLWLEIVSMVPHTRRSRILDLIDSGAGLGALAKGRSPSWNLNGLLRRRMALEVVAAVYMIFAWVNSHLMPSDRLSRERVVRGLIRAYMRAGSLRSSSTPLPLPSLESP